MNQYGEMIRHMEWADAQLWKVIVKEPSLFMSKEMQERLYHFHCTQRAFGQILDHHPIEIPDLGSFADLRSIGLWVRRFYNEFAPMLINRDESEIDKLVDIPWSSRVVERFGGLTPANAGECIIQVVLHTMHHRGQVMTRLREAGGSPPLVDFIAWVWMGQPAADWGFLEKD